MKATWFGRPESMKNTTSAPNTTKAATPERTTHFRACDSGSANTATLATSIGTIRTRRKMPSWITYGRTSGPSQPGIKKMPAACTTTIAVRPATYGNSHFRIGW